MRYDFICTSSILDVKLNCPYESFKLFEFWFHLSLANRPTSKREIFFKADPDFILEKPSCIIMTLGLEGTQTLFQSCLEKRHMEVIKGYSSIKQRIEEINTSLPL